jgi:zinc finger protein
MEADLPFDEVPIDTPCPQCQGPLRMITARLDLPVFGDALQTTIHCTDCAFRHADVLLTREGRPMRDSLHVTDEERRRARVVRSQSGTVRIPELGAAMEPGPAADAFITNAEGVLWRFRDVAAGAVATGTEERPNAAQEVVDRMDAMIEGKEPFTVIIEDPSGNSAILHGATERVPLTPDEAASLKHGAFTFEVDGGTT